MPRIKVYKDRKGEFRWTLLADNNRKIADSGEGYKTKPGAVNAAKRLKKQAPTAEIDDQT